MFQQIANVEKALSIGNRIDDQKEVRVVACKIKTFDVQSDWRGRVKNVELNWFVSNWNFVFIFTVCSFVVIDNVSPGNESYHQGFEENKSMNKLNKKNNLLPVFPTSRSPVMVMRISASEDFFLFRTLLEPEGGGVDILKNLSVDLNPTNTRSGCGCEEW